MRWELSEEALGSFPPLQWAILDTAAQMVRVGGILVYATCTINRAENQDIAERFEATVGDRFAPAPLVEAWGECIAERVLSPVGPVTEQANAAAVAKAHTVQLLPHVHRTDGFFIARWRRCK